MAAKSSSLALKKLNEQLTCSVCLGQLTSPKTLSCLHSFCHGCLERLTDLNNEVRCPTCRSEFELGKDGVHSLQTSFLVNNLMEVHEMLKKVSHDKMVLCDICSESFSTGYCQQCESFTCDTCLEFHNKWKKNSIHRVITLEELADSAYDIPRAKSEVVMKCPSHNKPLDIFCETCDELVCQHCTVKIHRDHEYDVVSDVYDNQCETIRESIEPVDRRIDECQAMIEQLDMAKLQLENKGGKVKEAIQERVSNIMEMFFAAAEQLSLKVDRAIVQEEQRLEKRQDVIKNSLNKLRGCKDHVEQSLSIGSPQQVLSSKTKLIEHTRVIMKDCDLSKINQQQEFVIKLKQGGTVKKSFVNNSIGTIHHELVNTGPSPIEQIVFEASPMKSSFSNNARYGQLSESNKDDGISISDSVPVEYTTCDTPELSPFTLPKLPIVDDCPTVVDGKTSSQVSSNEPQEYDNPLLPDSISLSLSIEEPLDSKCESYEDDSMVDNSHTTDHSLPNGSYHWTN